MSNQDIICKSVINIADKLSQMNAGKAGHGQGKQKFGYVSTETKAIEEEKFAPLAQESSKVAVDVAQGIFMEALKKFMFACQASDHAVHCKHDALMTEESKQ